MSLTLGMTGMDPATEAALKAAFSDANERLKGHWRLAPENEADHVVVDMDSMYGPMSWLRLHAAGKRVIGLTSAPRTQTDFRLGRPFNSLQIAHLLEEIAHSSGIDLSALAKSEVSAPVDKTTAAPAPTPPPAPAAPKAAEPPAHAEPAPTPAPAAPLPTPPAPPPAANIPPAQPRVEAAVPAAPRTPPARVEPEPTPAAPARDTGFADWLKPGAMTGYARYRRGDGPTVFIDHDRRQYFGPAALKPLAPYFEGLVRLADFKPVDEKTWATETAGLGAAQSLTRLQWLGGLIAGQGLLLPGYDPYGRFQLNKWPQTEREYPKHFRIATAMMKGPATLEEIASASGMPLSDVTDFVNASLATGFAEPASETPAAPAEPSKPTGLLGRLRGK